MASAPWWDRLQRWSISYDPPPTLPSDPAQADQQPNRPLPYASLRLLLLRIAAVLLLVASFVVVYLFPGQVNRIVQGLLLLVAAHFVLRHWNRIWPRHGQKLMVLVVGYGVIRYSTSVAAANAYASLVSILLLLLIGLSLVVEYGPSVWAQRTWLHSLIRGEAAS